MTREEHIGGKRDSIITNKLTSQERVDSMVLLGYGPGELTPLINPSDRQKELVLNEDYDESHEVLEA